MQIRTSPPDQPLKVTLTDDPEGEFTKSKGTKWIYQPGSPKPPEVVARIELVDSPDTFREIGFRVPSGEVPEDKRPDRPEDKA